MAYAKRKCVICGTKFMPKNQVQRTCGDDCSKEYKRRQNQKRHKKKLSKARKQKKKQGNEKLEIKVCQNCGREFATDCPTKKYCCQWCRVTYGNLARSRNPSPKNGLSQLGKINVNRWIRLQLSDGTVATNKKPYTPELCASLYKVPVGEIYAALEEYDEAHKNGTEKEFYKK